MIKPDNRIGAPYLRCDPAKVIAVVATHAPDRNSAFASIDETSKHIAGHLIEFFRDMHPQALGPQLFALQSGVGNIANAVLAGLQRAAPAV